MGDPVQDQEIMLVDLQADQTIESGRLVQDLVK